MTAPKQSTVMAAMKTKYARNQRVTMNAGTSMSQKRKAVMLALLFGLVASVASAQNTGTVMPFVKSCWYDTNGDPIASGHLFFYAAGTETALAVYTDSALSIAHAQPVVLGSDGCETIFMQPSAYKVVLKNTAETTTYWTVDNVNATAPYSIDLDVDAIAGETLSARAVVFLSDGTGGRTAGRWYLTDSDTAAMSITANQIGMTTAAISSGDTGSVRLQGRVTGLSALSTGSSYYASATAGALTSTAPTNRRFIGVADSTTTLILASAQFQPATPTLNTLTVVGGDITVGTIASGLISNTSDGSDTKSVGVSGGGAGGSDSRGGYLFAYGNEHATQAGDISIAAGNVAGAEILLSGTAVLTGRYNSASAQPGFLAYNSSDDTGASTGTVDFDTEKYDVAGNFAADTFTAPVTGEYLFTATVMLTSDATVGIAEIILADSGGDSYSVQHEFAASETTSLTGSWIIRLTAAETVTIQFQLPATGYVIEGAAHVTTFSGRLLP